MLDDDDVYYRPYLINGKFETVCRQWFDELNCDKTRMAPIKFSEELQCDTWVALANTLSNPQTLLILLQIAEAKYV